MKNRMIRFLIAVFTVFAITSMAHASNQITMSSDKPLMPDSTCGEAGATSLQFDDETVIAEGDVIKFALSNGVTVCGTLDYYIKLADDGETLFGTGNTPADAPITSTDQSNADVLSVVNFGTCIGAEPNGSTLIDASGSAFDVGFRVQATDGERYITLTLGRRQLTSIGNTEKFSTETTDDDMYIRYNATNADSFFILKLFSGDTTATDGEPCSPDATSDGVAVGTIASASTSDYFYERNTSTTTAGFYDNAGLSEEKDNTLCIDTATGNYSADYVYAIPASEPFGNDSTYKQNFLGDYIVAQIIDEMLYTVAEACKDATCNYISTTAGVSQGGDTIAATGAFDFGNYSESTTASTVDRWSSTGYCNATTSDLLGNGIKFSLSGDNFDEGDQFRFTFTIRAGSTASTTLATWDAYTAEKAFYEAANSDNICESGSTVMTNTATPSTADGQHGGSLLNDATAYRDTYTVNSTQSTFGALVFDLPDATINLTNATAGQKVYVDIVVEKLPCGTIATESICIAELIATCPSVAGAAIIDGIMFVGDTSFAYLHGYLGRVADNTPAATLTFPYAPPVSSTDYWAGIAISNIGTASAQLVFTLTDALGGTATYTKTGLAAGTQFKTTLGEISGDLVDGATALSTDQDVYISVTASAE